MPTYDRRTAARAAQLCLNPQGPHPRSNNMTPHIPMEFSTRLIDWGPIMIMSNTMPPRDPDEDEEDEDEEERADEPPVVREPDED
jgi:hypothetical protein